ncbi:unnamed protein product [Adineta ricciae]|uniref:Uncharacterized protein n=1 Tax=Adineta ricciae TaxID=249248 RepID=A0A815NPC4_ADIRI|nr:unnamed protein product [Adineta ricciae]CAF1432361.1 unnamed protein product [Adineta ricciae]
MDITNSLKRFIRRLLISVRELNLFSTFEDDDSHELRNQILATRIYLSLLIVSVLSLCIYTSLVSITETIIIDKPTYKQYQKLIENNHNPQCQCKYISIVYDQFIDLQAVFHPVCSSDFVSDKWIYFLHGLDDESYSKTKDFHRNAVYSFGLLRSLCELAKTTVNENVQQQLPLKSYITSHVKGVDGFFKEIFSFLDTLILTEETKLTQLLTIFRRLIITQELISTQSTNIRLFAETSSLMPGQQRNPTVTTRTYYHKKVETRCDCRRSTCVEEYILESVKNKNILFIIPNFYQGCFITDSLLQSSLTYFYNKTCIEQLLFHLNSSLIITPINLNLSSKKLLNIDETVDELINHLMVYEWNKSISFMKYYELCEPLQCIYTYNHRFVITYVITILLGLLGGLVTVLRILVPFVIRMIRKKRKDNDIRISKRLWLKEKIKNFNLFKSIPPSKDYEIIYPQVVSTYLYIIVFLLSFVVLIIYTSLLTQTVTVIVRSPSIEQYERLKDQHSDTLICECTQISIDLQTFIQLSPEYHQICTSIYVTDEWYNYLRSFTIFNGTSEDIGILPFDFRATTGPSFFRTLELFCKIVDDIIQNHLKIFNSTIYVTGTVEERLNFLEQHNQSVQLFKSTIQNTFFSSLEMFFDILHGNTLFSWSMTNHMITLRSLPFLSIVMATRTYDENCVCVYSGKTCFEPARIFHLYYNGTKIDHERWTVPYIYSGCYILTGVMASDLRCLYHPSCLSELIKNIRPTYKMNASLLKEHSSTSKFNSRTPIFLLIREAMVERWKENISYEQYYEKCNPKRCTYTYAQRFLIGYIISTVFGIVGGLSSILRLIIPNLVQFAKKMLKKIRNEDDNNDQDDEENPRNFNDRLRKFSSKIIIFIKTLNLFQHPSSKIPPSRPIFEYEKVLQLKLQISSTRLYIFLLFFSLIVTSIYAFLQRTNERKIYSISSYIEYENLQNKFPSNSFFCPCTTVGSEYSTFISLRPKIIHPACTNYLFRAAWIVDFVSFEFAPIEENLRIILIYYLPLASQLCMQSQTIIQYNVKQFLNTIYTTSFLTNREEFEKYFHTQIEQLKQSLPSELKRIMKISSIITSANSLMSAAKTNYEWMFMSSTGEQIGFPMIGDIILIRTKVKYYSNQNYSCKIFSQSFKQQINWPGTTIPIPGLYLSCYFADGLLQSTFQCFYDINCLESLQFYTSSMAPIQTWVLPMPSKTSLYQINSTVQDLVNVLFVEEWFSHISYELYYQQCQPKQCYYTFIRRSTINYIIIMVITVLGGLHKVLPVIIPVLIRISHKIIIKFKKRRFRRQPRKINRINPRIPSFIT